jgi:hypothetical protein
MIQFFLLNITFPPTPYNIYRKFFGKFAKMAKIFDFRRKFFCFVDSDVRVRTKFLLVWYNLKIVHSEMYER